MKTTPMTQQAPEPDPADTADTADALAAEASPAADFAGAATVPAPVPAPAPATAVEPEGSAPAAAEPVVEPPPSAAPATPPAAPDLSPAACGARLAQLFPALFGPEALRPMKLRIQADIQQRAPGVFSRRILGIYFSRYTTGNAYLKALTLAPHRFDLDGAPAGEISEEHRRLAAEELALRRQAHEARRAAERPAGPPGAERPPREGTSASPAAPRPPRADGDRPRHDRPARPARPGQPARFERHERHERHERPAPQPPRHERPPQPHVEPSDRTAVEPLADPGAPLDPAEREARRERAALLHAFESTTLTAANFCALKRIDPATLDERLAQARNERGGAPAASRRSR